MAFSSFGKKYENEIVPYVGPHDANYVFGEVNSIYSLVNRTIIDSIQFNEELEKATILSYASVASSPTYVWTL